MRFKQHAVPLAIIHVAVELTEARTVSEWLDAKTRLDNLVKVLDKAGTPHELKV